MKKIFIFKKEKKSEIKLGYNKSKSIWILEKTREEVENYKEENLRIYKFIPITESMFEVKASLENYIILDYLEIENYLFLIGYDKKDLKKSFLLKINNLTCELEKKIPLDFDINDFYLTYFKALSREIILLKFYEEKEKSVKIHYVYLFKISDNKLYLIIKNQTEDSFNLYLIGEDYSSNISNDKQYLVRNIPQYWETIEKTNENILRQFPPLSAYELDFSQNKIIDEKWTYDDSFLDIIESDMSNRIFAIERNKKKQRDVQNGICEIDMRNQAVKNIYKLENSWFIKNVNVQENYIYVLEQKNIYGFDEYGNHLKKETFQHCQTKLTIISLNQTDITHQNIDLNKEITVCDNLFDIFNDRFVIFKIFEESKVEETVYQKIYIFDIKLNHLEMVYSLKSEVRDLKAKIIYANDSKIELLISDSMSFSDKVDVINYSLDKEIEDTLFELEYLFSQ